MVKSIIINCHYMTPLGVCLVIGCANINGVQIYEYHFYKDQGRHTILRQLAESTWEEYAGDDFPNQEDPKLPPGFDLLFDIKRESQLPSYYKQLREDLEISTRNLKDFNEMCAEYGLLGKR